MRKLPGEGDGDMLIGARGLHFGLRWLVSKSISNGQLYYMTMLRVKDMWAKYSMNAALAQ